MVAFYDPILVALSVAVAIFGSLTALLISSDYEKRLGIGGYAGCLACYGGIVMGGSIWSMHFIAMLALNLPVSISYEPWRTALSLALPIAVTGLSLRIASRNSFGAWSIPVGGLLMGLAIAGMHYTGMDAVRGCGIANNPIGVASAIVWATWRQPLRSGLCSVSAAPSRLLSVPSCWGLPSRACTTRRCLQ